MREGGRLVQLSSRHQIALEPFTVLVGWVPATGGAGG